MKHYKMWIMGKWVEAESGRRYTVFNPATEEEIAQVPLGGTGDVDKAVDAARKAFPLWSEKPQAERSHFRFCWICDRDNRQVETQSRTFALFAFDRNGAAMGLNCMLGDRKPQSAATLGTGSVRFVETLPSLINFANR